jgi:hypothetical protein
MKNESDFGDCFEGVYTSSADMTYVIEEYQFRHRVTEKRLC